MERHVSLQLYGDRALLAECRVGGPRGATLAPRFIALSLFLPLASSGVEPITFISALFDMLLLRPYSFVNTYSTPPQAVRCPLRPIREQNPARAARSANQMAGERVT